MTQERILSDKQSNFPFTGALEMLLNSVYEIPKHLLEQYQKDLEKEKNNKEKNKKKENVLNT